jgi:hypothetical protein
MVAVRAALRTVHRHAEALRPCLSSSDGARLQCPARRALEDR